MNKRIFFIFLFLSICGLSFYFFRDTFFLESKVKKESVKNNSVDSMKIEKITKPSFFLFPKFTNNQIVKHAFYTLSYSEKDEQAEWVAYRLYKNSVNDSVKRKDNFREDSLVVTGSSTLLDYKNSGYDRGHLAPAKAMSFNKVSMNESFYMSNMSPQDPSFNRGIWKKLEEEVRSWIAISDSLYVVTGPILKDASRTIGINKVTVPKAYYKAIIRFINGNSFGIGFLMNNEKSNKLVSSFTVSIDSIEKITNLDFFSNLETTIQNRVEANKEVTLFLQK